MKKGRECFYRDKDGKPQDAAFHDEILNNPEADKKIAERAVQKAIEDGLSPELAQQLYGYKPQEDG